MAGHRKPRDNAHESTLFHLIPKDGKSHETLLHEQNCPFVSPSSQNQRLGLEIGFHVTNKSSRVIARLGRNSDLVLPDRSISKVHVAFEFEPESSMILLSERSTRGSSITIGCIQDGRDSQNCDHSQGASIVLETVQGEYFLECSVSYRLVIGKFTFDLEWRGNTTRDLLKELATRDYQEACLKQALIPSRDLPTEDSEGAETRTWRHTRIYSTRQCKVLEAEDTRRVAIGRGSYGTVFKAAGIDGRHLAIKVFKLKPMDGRYDRPRNHALREVHILKNLKHDNIIECLGYDKFNTPNPEIAMPMRDGNLRQYLSTRRRLDDDQLCDLVLAQMLSALDYLSVIKICHRDIKPENILFSFSPRPHEVVFQLADFGLANHCEIARTSCGTRYYEAPELYDQSGTRGQSPKMDIWSLFATLVHIHNAFEFRPAPNMSYAEVFQLLKSLIRQLSSLVEIANGNPQNQTLRARLALIFSCMAKDDPDKRASAADILYGYYGGSGLTAKSKSRFNSQAAQATKLSPQAPATVASSIRFENTPIRRRRQSTRESPEQTRRQLRPEPRQTRNLLARGAERLIHPYRRPAQPQARVLPNLNRAPSDVEMVNG